MMGRIVGRNVEPVGRQGDALETCIWPPKLWWWRHARDLLALAGGQIPDHERAVCRGGHDALAIGGVCEPGGDRRRESPRRAGCEVGDQDLRWPGRKRSNVGVDTGRPRASIRRELRNREYVVQ